MSWDLQPFTWGCESNGKVKVSRSSGRWRGLGLDCRVSLVQHVDSCNFQLNRLCQSVEGYLYASTPLAFSSGFKGTSGTSVSTLHFVPNLSYPFSLSVTPLFGNCGPIRFGHSHTIPTSPVVPSESVLGSLSSSDPPRPGQYFFVHFPGYPKQQEWERNIIKVYITLISHLRSRVVDVGC